MHFFTQLIQPHAALLLAVWVGIFFGPVLTGFRGERVGFYYVLPLVWLITGIVVFVSWVFQVFS